ncbi:fimbria/pilus periplasmic chaperone [Escherichia coli]
MLLLDYADVDGYGWYCCWGTRVIFYGDKPDTTISIFNKETNLPYLLQTSVNPFNKEDKSKPPFSVIPPVSRIEPQQEKILRIKNGWREPKDGSAVYSVEREKYPSFN